MDWADSAQQAEFRAKVRKCFEDNLRWRYREELGPIRPHTIRASNGEEILATHADWGVDRYSEDPEVKGAADDWAKAMAAEGYIASSWPKDLGGADFTTLEQFIFNEERGRANAPRVGGTGAMFLGSLLMVYGSEEQQASGCRRSPPGRSTGRRATPSPAAAPISPRCGAARSATATSTWCATRSAAALRPRSACRPARPRPPARCRARRCACRD